MDSKRSTVLVTGGASGIGLALAVRFLDAGSRVIIVGRREEKLKEAQAKHPELHYRVCDLSSEAEREKLVTAVLHDFPDLNVLVNNAGIQQRINLRNASEDWSYYQQEIRINTEAPIHLTMRFMPHFIQKESAAVINVSSGLALRPGAWVPVYSAAKAAVHAFTKTLRLQLEGTPVKVMEVLPPAVNTDLGGAGIHAAGAPLDAFADEVFGRILRGDQEIGYGESEARLHASKAEIDEGMRSAWESFKKRNLDF